MENVWISVQVINYKKKVVTELIDHTIELAYTNKFAYPVINLKQFDMQKVFRNALILTVSSNHGISVAHQAKNVNKQIVSNEQL